MKPILFNTEMVRAILDGRKTVTRRPVKLNGRNVVEIEKRELSPFSVYACVSTDGALRCEWITKPYRPGNILYVRETWAAWSHTYGTVPEIIYKADGYSQSHKMKWSPSIHMPREAARIFLRVTDVRVERLQDMTEDDAFAEGYIDKDPWCFHHVYENYPESPIPCYASSCKCPPDPPCNHSIPELFGKEIWNSTLKPKDRALYGWDANPYVWVIEFERINREDAMQWDKS